MAETTMDRLFDEPDGPTAAPAHKAPLRQDTLGDRARWAAPWLAMLVVAAGIAPFRSHWVVQVAILGWMLFAPGRLALTAMRIRPMQVRRTPIYTLALSLLIIMLTGLAVDGVGIASGIDRPLSAGPLWVGTTVAYLLLLGGAAAAPRLYRRRLSPPPSLLPYWVLLLPLLAAAGAARLNSGNGSTLALIAMIALVAVWLISPFLPGFTWRSASITVYAVSLAGTWSFSLRGDSVFGYDIVTEYFISQNTASAGVWHLHHSGDAYGGLLSITILPAVLHALSGTSLLLLFKLAFPAIFAFVPVTVFQVALRILPYRWAYLAVGLILGQPFFFNSMTAVARQEIAFVFFATLIAALVAGRGRAMTILACAGCTGLILAHYSSTYMAAALLAVATIVALAGWALRRKPPIARTAITCGVLIAGSILWYRGLTDSADNVGRVADTLRARGLNILPNQSGGNLIGRFISGNVAATLSPNDYERLVKAYYSSHFQFVQPFPGSEANNLEPANALPNSGELGHLGSQAVSFVNQVVNVLAVIGAVLLTFSRSQTRAARIIGLLSVGVLAFIIVVRLSGTVAVAYNQERAQIQAFILLGPAAVYAGRQLIAQICKQMTRLQRVPRQQYLYAVSATAIMILIWNASGLLRAHPTQNGAANLSSNGGDVARFVLKSKDLQAAAWLNAENPTRQLTYGDAYGQLRILTARGSISGVLTDITPGTLGQGSWVYAYSENILDSTAHSSYGGRPVTFRFPTRYIETHYDRVYTNGSSEVFH